MSSLESSLEVEVGSLVGSGSLTNERIQELIEADDWYYSDSSDETTDEEEDDEQNHHEEWIPPVNPVTFSTTSLTLNDDVQSTIDFFLSKLGNYDDIEEEETDEANRDSEAALLLLEMEANSLYSTPSSTLDRKIIQDDTLSKVPRPQYYYIAKELMTSERTYVQGVHLLEKVLHGSVKTARKTKKSILPEFYRKRIFLNIGEIHALNQDLLLELEKRMSNWTEQTVIADMLVSRAPFFKLYSMYTSRFEDAQVAYFEAIKHYKPFAELVHHIENSTLCRGLPLSSYLLYPIQRIPRYRLLLEDYLKHLPEGHSDVANAKTALKAISEVAQHLNDRIKDLEQQTIVVKLQNLFVGKESLVVPGRRFLLRGPVEQVSGRRLNKKRMKVLFVFSDVVLVAKVTRNIKFKIQNKLPLSTLQVSSMHSKVTENTFCLFTPSVSKPFRFCSRNNKEREKFVKCIRMAIRQEVERNKTFTTARVTQSLNDLRAYNAMLQDPCFDSRQPHTKRRKMNVLSANDDSIIEETDSSETVAEGEAGGVVSQESVAFAMEEYDGVIPLEGRTDAGIDNTLSNYVLYWKSNDTFAMGISDDSTVTWCVLNYRSLNGYTNHHESGDSIWSLPLVSCSSVAMCENDDMFVLKLIQSSNTTHFLQFDNKYDYTRWSDVLQDFLKCDCNNITK